MTISPIIKKLDRYLNNYDFKLAFNNISSHTNTEYTTNTSTKNMKRFSLYRIETFVGRGLKFSHIFEMKIKTNIK